MFARMKGANGGTVIVNPAHVIFVDDRMTDKGPIIGQSQIVCLFGVMVVVKGTPSEVYGILRKAERDEVIETV